MNKPVDNTVERIVYNLLYIRGRSQEGGEIKIATFARFLEKGGDFEKKSIRSLFTGGTSGSLVGDSGSE